MFSPYILNVNYSLVGVWRGIPFSVGFVIGGGTDAGGFLRERRLNEDEEMRLWLCLAWCVRAVHEEGRRCDKSNYW